MASTPAEITVEPPPTLNPLDVIPDEIPFDVPYGVPISLQQAQAVIQAAVAEARKRNWKMNVAVTDSGGNLVAFQRMDGAMLASIQIAEHKARAAVTFRRPTKVFEDGVQLMHLNYLLAFDGIIASRGGILVTSVSEPLPEHEQENGVRAVFFLVEVTAARLDRITDLFDQGKLIARVGSVLPLEQARLAHEMLAGAPHKRGKIVLEVDG